VALADEAGEGGLSAGRAAAEAASTPLAFAAGGGALTAGAAVAEHACCW